jgi:hypothetical protein
LSEPKSKLVKARVTARMKAAVTAAAEARGWSREAESIILRDALGEYLTARGYLASRNAPTARTTDEPGKAYGDRTEIFHHEIPPAPRKPRAKKKKQSN